MLGAGAIAALEGTRFADVRVLVETDSTMADAVALARSGAPDGVVVVADHQRAGRGRRGRSWQAPPGSGLLASVLLRPPPGAPGLCTMAAAVAAVEACSQVAAVTPALKWPNDVVLPDPAGGEAKLAGILGQAVAVTGGAAPAVVVGMGMNVNRPVGSIGEGVALSQLAGGEVDRGDLLASWLVRLDGWCTSASGPGRADALLGAYRARCSTLGRAVRVETPSEVFEGVAVDLGSRGELVVATGGRRRPVAAADVVHLRPAGSPA